ncbi:MAG TPA: GH25 family lysozyme [Kofleriaceae bacterium]|nr:GH25 family lysozyme [Kofleriaceae bacterium]
MTVKWALACALAACTGGEPAPDPDDPIVCGKGPTVAGIDVSFHQGDIDWPAVRAGGVEFAFIRAADGVDRADPEFARNWGAAGAQGLLRGAYQFFRPAQDPIAQADLMLGMLAGSSGELPPALAVEATGELTPPEIEAAVRAWLDRVRPALGREPILYTGFYFWRDEVGAPDLTSSPLWHAQYTSAACPRIAPPWRDWAFWQHSNTGRVAGIAVDVDLDIWNGTREELASFAAR